MMASIKGKRKFYLLDPFTGFRTQANKGISNYNMDEELIKNIWGADRIQAFFIKEYLAPESVKDISSLSFTHLNTGDFDAEIKALPYIYEKLLTGGYIIFDLYGWLPNEKQKQIDKLLSDLRASSYLLVSKQLIIFKPIFNNI